MEIVIARYNENITWLAGLENIDITVYNKGDNNFWRPSEPRENNYIVKSLPNIGREAHTYLTHIIENWDDLADYTVFCFGLPFDHSANFLSELHNVQNSYNYDMLNETKTLPDFHVFTNSQLGFIHEQINTVYPFPNGKQISIGPKFVELYETLFSQEYTKSTIDFTPAGIWMLSKDRIQSLKFRFYEELMKYVEKEYYAPWVLERLWENIFNGEVK